MHMTIEFPIQYSTLTIDATTFLVLRVLPIEGQMAVQITTQMEIKMANLTVMAMSSQKTVPRGNAMGNEIDMMLWATRQE